jgi:hypothetical protein
LFTTFFIRVSQILFYSFFVFTLFRTAELADSRVEVGEVFRVVAEERAVVVLLGGKVLDQFVEERAHDYVLIVVLLPLVLNALQTHAGRVASELGVDSGRETHRVRLVVVEESGAELLVQVQVLELAAEEEGVERVRVQVLVEAELFFVFFFNKNVEFVLCQSRT